VVSGFMYIVSVTTRSAGTTSADYKMIELADAGIERAYRAIKDDTSPVTATGTADLRGATTSGTAGTATTRNYIRYVSTLGSVPGDGLVLAMSASGAGTNVVLQNFDLNYLNATIRSVMIGCRYAKSSSGGNNPTLTITYTTTGVFPDVSSSTFSTTVSSTSYNAEPLTTLGATAMNITADRTWTWSLINSANFQIRATASNSSNRSVNLDFLFLRVTYDIDTNTDPWYTGSYAIYPVTLGGGTIQSVTITDEQGKVHLNTASQAMLRYIMVENGVADATANPLATAIVAYRTGANGPFDSVEELQQVPGMTGAIYAAMAPDVTVYSYINTGAQNPAGSRAPININTAPREALLAIFDPLTFSAPSDRTSLADAIITRRGSAPFTCYYSANAAVTTDFYDFVRAQSYLSDAEDDAVLSNADASLLQPTRFGGASGSCLSTEFCYASNAFNVSSLGRVGTRNVRAQTIVGHDGSRTFTTYVGDPAPAGWRKENFE